jgi:hypothetical protein
MSTLFFFMILCKMIYMYSNDFLTPFQTDSLTKIKGGSNVEF